MDCMKAILTRRSVRRFGPGPVDPEALRALLEAAMHAPSAGNQQPWRFVVIRERATLEAIAAGHPYAIATQSCALAVLVCAATGELRHPDFWPQDCSAATENLLVAAQSLGLGSVWMGLYPRRERMELLSRLAHLPEGLEPFALVALGHPLEHSEPPDRYHAEWIHGEHWGEPLAG